jgi:hypothetical protein
MIRKALAIVLVGAALVPVSQSSLPAQGSASWTWTPRSYTVSSDMQGGVTGGKSSSYPPTSTISHI